MANYLYIVTDKARAEKIASWVGEAEVRTLGGCQSFYMARGAKKDCRPDGVFKGYAVDHEGNRLIFSGASAAPDANTPMEGCYFRSQTQGQTVVIGNDLFAQLALIYFEAPGVVAVSDSLFVLSELRKHLGLPCKIDAEVMLGRSWINSISAQLLNDRTPIRGIRFAVPGTILTVDVDEDRPRLSVEKVAAAELFGGGVECYRETIREGARRTSALIWTLLDLPESSVGLGMSGGLDSRACLAAVLRSGSVNSVRIGTVPARENDFPVVQHLSEKFGFPINQPPKPDRPGETETLNQTGLWMLACAGIYDPLYCPKVTVRNAANFTIGGHGAELYKGNYGWRSIARITESAKKTRANHGASATSLAMFKSESEEGLERLGIDPADPWGSEWHYLGYRNSLHAGRSAMASLLGVRPLLQRKLLGLSRSPLNEFAAPKKGAPSIVTDMLIALHPELAAEPYDDPKKDMSRGYVEERTRFLGNIEDIEPYGVIGDPREIDSGPTAFFDKLVRNRGFALGRFTAERMSRMVGMAADSVPIELRQTYQPLIEMARNEMVEPVFAGHRPVMAAGKVMAFALAD